MIRKLKSGIEVDSEKYYQLLEWKYSNFDKFIWWCKEHGLYQEEEQSISNLDNVYYKALLDFANI